MIPCTVCHNRVAHPNADKYEPIKGDVNIKNFEYENHLDMKKGCWRCHSDSDLFNDPKTLAIIKSDKKPPSKCIACHNHDFPFPEGHADKMFRLKEKHGALARKNLAKCMTCHAAGKKFDNDGDVWCSKCHGRTKPSELVKQ